jgi:spermidine dehydrogenase
MSRRRPRPTTDRDLGMDRSITRRDFVQGLAAGAAGALAGALPAWAAEPPRSPSTASDLPAQDPPRRTGLRGSQPGSFEAAHACRDGTPPPPITDSGERYDLVVVGAGLSGLSAAHFYRERNPSARILVLDNHDDFGGHARRNEFVLGGRVQLMNGGTLDIDSPRPYGPVAQGVLRALGVDAERLARTIQHPDHYARLGLSGGVFFDRETFGADFLAVGQGKKPWPRFLAGTPLSPKARLDVERVEVGTVDHLPGLTSAEKKRRLLRLSYRDYLARLVQVGPEALAYYQCRTQGEWGVGADAVPALDAWGIGLPGFKGLGLEPGSIRGMGFTPAGYADTGGSVHLHFPDGNATLARLLVRRLIPEALPGRSVEDVVLARVDYRRLDQVGAPVRLRLDSTVVRVKHVGDPGAAEEIDVAYVGEGRGRSVRARHGVMACYNMMIPYLCPELPASQQAALRQLVKTPLVYTSVAIRTWRAFARLGIQGVHAPGGYHTSVRLNPTVDVGGYRSPRSPDEPNLVWMTRTPCQPGLSEHEQNRAGRAELLATPFEVFERKVRDQLGRMLRTGGFDPAADITAITVNRWPHGYAPEHNALFDPDLPDDQEAHVMGRARLGRIAIANSDAGGGAYTDVAIEQAHRAVSELLGG